MPEVTVSLDTLDLRGAEQAPVQGVHVDNLQGLLNATRIPAYLVGAIDGIGGRMTKEAVLAFQRANGLAQDAIVGPQTWEALVPFDAETAIAPGLDTPEDASVHLYESWRQGDRQRALRYASEAAVNELFRTSFDPRGADWEFAGCDELDHTAADPGFSCFFSFEGGGANFIARDTDAAGWRLVEVGFIAD